MSLSLSAVRSSTFASLSLALFFACSSSKDAPIDAPASTNGPDAAGDTGAPPPKAPECRNPKPVLAFDQSDTGYVSCDGGAMHRVQMHACPTRLPRATLCGFPPVDGGLKQDCRSDSECTTKPKGFCTTSSHNATCFCDYGCTEDADCPAGNICVCGDPQGQCMPAECTSDAQCGGLLCLRSNDTTCGKAFACQKPTDPCTSNLDCKPPYSACTIDKGVRSCQAPGFCP